MTRITQLLCIALVVAPTFAAERATGKPVPEHGPVLPADAPREKPKLTMPGMPPLPSPKPVETPAPRAPGCPAR
jgi:hypothetical protein